jgi:D-beta-D-heptose 7-phosphate kinase/D-beta-D-heptose 1-phosphate adenosyltransferase
MIELNNTQQQKKFKILLIGDSCIDEYVFGTVDRLSPEAPVPVLHIKKQEIRPGMAANVKENLLALGCEVDFITNKESIVKKRFVDSKSGYHLLRVDDESTLLPWTDATFSNYNHYDAVIISDYNKGFLTYESMVDIRNNYAGPIFIDTKKQDLKQFVGFHVKINELEYHRRSSDTDELIVTLGSHGARYKDVVYSPPAVEVFDVCGAGDTFLSALAFEYLRSGFVESAIKFANSAAAITVTHSGNYAPLLEEIQ